MLTRIISDMASRSMLSTGPEAISPALEKAMSIRPKRSMASAIMTFLIGHFVGEHVFKNYSNTAFMRISDRLKDTGITGLAALRMVPIAPFTLVNMILGASSIKLLPYIVATVLGLMPGMAAMVILGDSLATIWRNPDPQNLLYIALAIIIWLSVLTGIHILLKSERERRGKEYV